MSGLIRFLRLGLADADRRLSALTARDGRDDRAAIAIIESSRVCQAVARAADLVPRAGQSSRLLGLGRSMSARWSRSHWSDRRLALGTGLLVASAVHVALLTWTGNLYGWLWAVIPATAAAIGALVLATSGVLPDARTPD